MTAHIKKGKLNGSWIKVNIYEGLPRGKDGRECEVRLYGFRLSRVPRFNISPGVESEDSWYEGTGSGVGRGGETIIIIIRLLGLAPTGYSASPDKGA
jgi:hypothetical protein